MADTAVTFGASDYLDRSFVPKGVGGWRALYLRFIEDLAPAVVMEVGAGTPDFLAGIEAKRRIAVDIGRRFADAFRNQGIEFVHRDLEHDPVADLGPVDVAVCSDVFEHLVRPAVALDRLTQVMGPKGILFSHVPNEYRLGHTMRVMAGQGGTLLFHRASQEWDDPHLRRFSAAGYAAFLERGFSHNLRLTDLRYRWPARLVGRAGVPVPYCLQGGPTYASTNDAATYERLVEIKKACRR